MAPTPLSQAQINALIASAGGSDADVSREEAHSLALPSDGEVFDVSGAGDTVIAALGAIRTGANGRDVHAQCVQVFTARGYETKTTPKGSVGFFHGTGHGLGLAVHEPPRSTRLSSMRASMVKRMMQLGAAFVRPR